MQGTPASHRNAKESCSADWDSILGLQAVCEIPGAQNAEGLSKFKTELPQMTLHLPAKSLLRSKDHIPKKRVLRRNCRW